MMSMMNTMNTMNAVSDSMTNGSFKHTDTTVPTPEPMPEGSDFARDDMVNAIRQILAEQEVNTDGSKSVT